MNARVVLCILGGHHWQEAGDVYESYPVLRCRRCGRVGKLTAESGRPEGWAERAAREQRACSYQDARIQRRP